MGAETPAIDISTMPDVARLVHDVAKIGTRHVLMEQGVAVAVLSPVRPRRRRLRGRPMTMDDPIWDIVGIITDDVGSDVSSNKKQYLAEAYASEFE